MASILDIFSGGVSSIGEGIASAIKGLIEEFHIPPDKALAAQQAATDAANKFVLDKAKLAQDAVDSALNAKQKELEAANADLANARARELAIVTSSNAPQLIKFVPSALAFIVIIGGGYLYYLIPEERTTLAAIMMLVLGYYFSSSSGSAKKDETIAQLSKP